MVGILEVAALAFVSVMLAAITVVILAVLTHIIPHLSPLRRFTTTPAGLLLAVGGLSAFLFSSNLAKIVLLSMFGVSM